MAWLHEGVNSVGAAPGSAVALPSGLGEIGRITLAGGEIIATFAGEAGVIHKGHPVTTLKLEDDSRGKPTVLTMGSLSFYVIRRGDQLAVRIKDPNSQARRAFTGIDYFPVDSRWRFETRFERYDPPGTVQVPTVMEREETYQVPGALAFDHDGQTYRIEAFLEEGETDLFLVFGDLTNRSETYGGGRYLYVSPPGDSGTVVVDFNKAYNPPCVFTPFATCALPLPQNRLPIRVEAGEKVYRGPTVGAPVVPRG